MAVREYIGARYITKFADPIEWDSSRAYEAIEAVQHEGFTYISKQPVPKNVQITNEDFWLLWADPNAQMEQLRQYIDTYDDRITENENAIEELQNSKDLFVICGDSWSSPQEGFNDWITRFQIRYGNPDIVNASKGGCGFNYPGNNNTGNFLTNLTNTVATMTEDQKRRCKGVICIGGVNDVNRDLNNETPQYSSLSQFRAAINALALYATNNLGCPVYWALDAEAWDRQLSGNYRESWIRSVKKWVALQDVFNPKAIPIYGIIEPQFGFQSNVMFEDDMLHPTNAYCDAIASAVGAAVYGGGYRPYLGNLNSRYNVGNEYVNINGFISTDGQRFYLSSTNVNVLQNMEDSQEFTWQDVDVTQAKNVMVAQMLRLTINNNLTLLYPGNVAADVQNCYLAVQSNKIRFARRSVTTPIAPQNTWAINQVIPIERASS